MRKASHADSRIIESSVNHGILVSVGDPQWAERTPPPPRPLKKIELIKIVTLLNESIDKYKSSEFEIHASIEDMLTYMYRRWVH